ncbi:hypothetical protein B0J14DRAFT_567730 [Halenospora varia]|nr:hypothetical protein B0J14DRAFT_567730 [Halenospora varia]
MEPERFVKVIAGYALMTEAELGLSTFIKCDGNGRYIVARDVRIYLEDKQTASQKAIVCRGTTCYRGRRPDSMDREQREGSLLKLAKERGVTGIAEWFNHEQITIDGDPDTISHLRRVMKFGALRKLSSKAFWVDESVPAAPPAGLPLHAYTSVRELLEALRDAIAGHKSLLEDGKILHRDVSENDIIITDAASGQDPKGRLIDLDSVVLFPRCRDICLPEDGFQATRRMIVASLPENTLISSPFADWASHLAPSDKSPNENHVETRVVPSLVEILTLAGK